MRELIEVVSSRDEVARFVGRSGFLKRARARLDLGNRRDGRRALACGGGVAVARYVETHEEAPRFGLIHPALPLFDLAAECYPDERRRSFLQALDRLSCTVRSRLEHV